MVAMSLHDEREGREIRRGRVVRPWELQVERDSSKSWSAYEMLLEYLLVSNMFFWIWEHIWIEMLKIENTVIHWTAHTRVKLPETQSGVDDNSMPHTGPSSWKS